MQRKTKCKDLLPPTQETCIRHACYCFCSCSSCFQFIILFMFAKHCFKYVYVFSFYFMLRNICFRMLTAKTDREAKSLKNSVCVNIDLCTRSADFCPFTCPFFHPHGHPSVYLPNPWPTSICSWNMLTLLCYNGQAKWKQLLKNVASTTALKTNRPLWPDTCKSKDHWEVPPRHLWATDYWLSPYTPRWPYLLPVSLQT